MRALRATSSSALAQSIHIRPTSYTTAQPEPTQYYICFARLFFQYLLAREVSVDEAYVRELARYLSSLFAVADKTGYLIRSMSFGDMEQSIAADVAGCSESASDVSSGTLYLGGRTCKNILVAIIMVRFVIRYAGI